MCLLAVSYAMKMFIKINCCVAECVLISRTLDCSCSLKFSTTHVNLFIPYMFLKCYSLQPLKSRISLAHSNLLVHQGRVIMFFFDSKLPNVFLATHETFELLGSLIQILLASERTIGSLIFMYFRQKHIIIRLVYSFAIRLRNHLIQSWTFNGYVQRLWRLL